MKRILTVILVLLSALSFAGAQDFTYGNVVPRDARSMGTGGSFSAVSWGFDSLFGNPAGFASKRGQLTLADASAWAYLEPSIANLQKLQTAAGGGSSNTSGLVSFLSDTITSNGLGGGANVGLGWAGGGVGLGAFVTVDANAYGASVLGTKLQTSAVANAVVGFGIPINIGDSFALRVGADLRPSVRIEAADGGWRVTDLLGALTGGGDIQKTLMGEYVVMGAGIAADLGAQLQIGSLSFGLAIRDISPQFPYKKITIDELSTGGMPDFTGSTKAGLLPSVTAGIAWRPVFIKYILEPGVYFELQDPVNVIKDKDSLWNLVHAGVDLKLLSIVTLRGGINRGWVSAGVGLNLWLVEVDAAVFTEELGKHPGDQGRSGVSIQASVHL